jgi:hypothetical protein
MSNDGERPRQLATGEVGLIEYSIKKLDLRSRDDLISECRALMVTRGVTRSVVKLKTLEEGSKPRPAWQMAVATR